MTYVEKILAILDRNPNSCVKAFFWLHAEGMLLPVTFTEEEFKASLSNEVPPQARFQSLAFKAEYIVVEPTKDICSAFLFKNRRGEYSEDAPLEYDPKAFAGYLNCVLGNDIAYSVYRKQFDIKHDGIVSIRVDVNQKTPRD